MEPETDVPPSGTIEEVSREDLANYLKSLNERLYFKMELRRKNLDANNNRPDEAFFRKLDSNLKKNTAFVKKIKTFTESQKASIIRDFNALNLSKYVAELATSVGEAKLKISDIPSVLELCSLIHQRYAEFAQNLLDFYFKKTFPKRKDDQITNLSKFRVDLRFLADLITVGIFNEKEGLQVLGAALNYLVQCDKGDHSFLTTVISFCKYCGEDYANLIPKRYLSAAVKYNVELPANMPVFSPERQKVVVNLLNDYFATVKKDLMHVHKDMKKQERRNQRQYDTKGEVHPEAKQRLDDAKSAFEKLNANLCLFSDLINQEAPIFPALDKGDDADLGAEGEATGDGGAIVEGTGGAFADSGAGMWEDVETQTFYESLPELRSMLPGILFKDSEKPTLPAVEEKITDEEEAQAVGSAEEQETGIDVEENDIDAAAGTSGVDEEPAETDAVSGSALKLLMDAFAAQLSNMVNRDLIDKAAIEFVTNLNTKTNRKRLVKALFGVHRNRLDLLPFYSRLVAVLQPVMPDVGTELVQMLIRDFRCLLRKKDQLLIETKIKCIRFIGELVKFKIFPKSEVLHCLKMLLFDFRHHSVDMCCALLDSCGYFLYHSTDSHQKTKILLEQMMRKRQAGSNMDQRYQLMIDNAYFTCIPPTATIAPKIERSPIQQFIRKLLFKDLEEHMVEKVLRQMRKLNWEDPETSSYAIQCLSQPWHVKYANVQWLASLLAGIMWYYDYVGFEVVDNILEDIRLGMEINNHKFNQRRICCVKYLGEMYNYRVVDSSIIFNMLYSLILFGVNYDTKMPPSPLDPPEHLFRIRLACVCLETCGEYFDRGLSKKKLDCYLTYLQRYYLMKKEASCWSDTERPFPIEIQNCLYDTIFILRPKLKFFKSLEEAVGTVKTVEDEYRAKVESALKVNQTKEEIFLSEDEEEEEEGRKLLKPVEEEEENESAALNERARNESFNEIGEGSDFEKLGDSLDDELDHLNDEDDDVNVRMIDKSVDEDDSFNAEFDKFISESLQSRMQEQFKAPQADFSVPLALKAKKHARFDDIDETPAKETKNDEACKTVNFFLMTKGKSNKVSLKTLKVPISSEMARALKDSEIAELQEKERVKQLTLDMTRRMQEEEMAEAETKSAETRRQVYPATQSQNPYGHQPDRHQQQSNKFQHQRGAPNPHEIFLKNWI